MSLHASVNGSGEVGRGPLRGATSDLEAVTVDHLTAPATLGPLLTATPLVAGSPARSFVCRRPAAGTQPRRSRSPGKTRGSWPPGAAAR